MAAIGKGASAIMLPQASFTAAGGQMSGRARSLPEARGRTHSILYQATKAQQKASRFGICFHVSASLDVDDTLVLTMRSAGFLSRDPTNCHGMP